MLCGYILVHWAAHLLDLVNLTHKSVRSAPSVVLITMEINNSRKCIPVWVVNFTRLDTLYEDIVYYIQFFYEVYKK